MANKPTRVLLALAMTLALSTAASSAAIAQTASRVDDRAVVADRDGFDFGWLGLLGLVGLVGLKRRETHSNVTTHPTR